MVVREGEFPCEFYFSLTLVKGSSSSSMSSGDFLESSDEQDPFKLLLRVETLLRTRLF